MITRHIKMNELSKIYAFSEKARNVNGDVIIKKGHFAVDGKSMLGIMSINLSEGATIEYPNDATEFDAFVKEFEI